jgi:hypothetical protein
MAGRIVRQGRLLALLILTAAALTPDAIHAQEIVLPSAATASASTDVASASSNTNYSQCTTDADCVLLDDACKSLIVVNQRFIADTNAGLAHDPACRPAATPSPVGIKATCRNGWCGLLPGRLPD